jgi:hypothetical protein
LAVRRRRFEIPSKHRWTSGIEVTAAEGVVPL